MFNLDKTWQRFERIGWIGSRCWHVSVTSKQRTCKLDLEDDSIRPNTMQENAKTEEFLIMMPWSRILGLTCCGSQHYSAAMPDLSDSSFYNLSSSVGTTKSTCNDRRSTRRLLLLLAQLCRLTTEPRRRCSHASGSQHTQALACCEGLGSITCASGLDHLSIVSGTIA